MKDYIALVTVELQKFARHIAGFVRAGGGERSLRSSATEFAPRNIILLRLWEIEKMLGLVFCLVSLVSCF